MWQWRCGLLAVVVLQLSTQSFADAAAVSICVDKVIDVAFLIDKSGSVRGNWKQMLNFVRSIIKKLTVGPNATRVAVVDFGDKGRLDFTFDKYSTGDEVLAAVNRIDYRSERTNMTGGFRVTRLEVFGENYHQRPHVQRTIVLITDGMPTHDVDKLDAEVDVIKRMGIDVIGVGVTNKVNETMLKKLVSRPPEENYVHAAHFASLKAVVDKLVILVCEKASAPKCKTQTDVKLKGPPQSSNDEHTSILSIDAFTGMPLVEESTLNDKQQSSTDANTSTLSTSVFTQMPPVEDTTNDDANLPTTTTPTFQTPSVTTKSPCVVCRRPVLCAPCGIILDILLRIRNCSCRNN